LPDCGLTATGITDDKARVTHFKDFSIVDALHHEEIFCLEACLLSILLDIRLEIDISLGFSLNTWEEIVDQTEENATIIDNNLWPVKITQGSHENFVLNYIRFSSLQFTGLSKHGLNGTKTPIIVSLL